MSDDQHRRTVLPLPPRRIRYGEEVDRGALSRRLRRLAADLATPSTSAPSTAPGRTYFNPFWLPASIQFHPAPSMRHAPPRTAAPVPEHSQFTAQTSSPPSQSSRHPRAPAQPRTPAVAPNAAEKLSDMERTSQWMRDGGRLPPLPSSPTSARMAANTYTGTPSTSGAAVAASLTAQTRSGGTSEKRPAPATPADKSAKRPKLATPQSKPGPAVSSTATAAIPPTSPKVLPKPDPVMSTSPSAVTHFKTEEKSQEAVPTASTPSLSDATCIKAEEPICPGTESTAFSSTSVPKSASNVEHTDAPPLTPASSSKPLPPVSVSDTTHRDVGHGGQNHTDVGPAASASASTSSTSALAFKHADCTRHSMFWQRDDFVVLRVQNTLFKLHRSRLEQESTFFADLFKRDTERPADRDTVDGCPVYLVDGTSAADFAVLMEAMDGGITYALNSPPFPAVASLLRAAHALVFPRILNFASHVLRTTWAPNLACLTSVRTPNAAETIVLARTCNIPEVLKRAYYELLRSPGFHQSSDDIDDANQRKAALEAAEYALLLAAREKLQEVWIQIASTPPDTSCPLISFPQPADAEPRRACEQAHAKGAELWAEMVGRAPVFKEGMLDPLGALENIIGMDWGARGLCTGCVEQRRTAWKDAKERIWGDLDAWLCLS